MTNKKFRAKPIKNQTIVITGASSGIGLATAKMAARMGARVVLAARSAEDLKLCTEKIREEGGQALDVVTDVSRPEDIIKLKEEAIAAFGQIDTWINNAGTSIYGYLMQGNYEEERKLFDTNFWGLRYGSCVAVEAMAKEGGTLINLGSEVSVAAQPLMGMYSASKHAVKAFTEALRSELKESGIPVAVSLIRPTAIATPFAEHGADRLQDGEPSLPSPLYHPDVAAEAILKCAANPQRDVYVGGPARLSAIVDTFFPRVKDLMAETRMKDLKAGTEIPHMKSNESLNHASADGALEEGNFSEHVAKSSLYTDITTMKFLKTLVGASGVSEILKNKKWKSLRS